MKAYSTKGFPQRMWVYLAEMYPVPTRLLQAALTYISIAAFARTIHGEATSLVSLHTALGIWSVFALMLILRLMDELKDKDIDRELFHERPLPSGRVLASDITLSLVAVIVLYLAANLWLGTAFWAALVVLGYSLLMFRHFFIPDILRKNLLLTLATHNPIIAIILLYGFALFAVENGLSLAQLKWDLTLVFVAMIWAALIGWEISRKTRAPEEENAYVTYSQVLGRSGAVFVAAGAQTIAFGIGLYLQAALSLSLAYLAVLTGGYGLAVWAHVRFLLNPNPLTSKLKPFAETFIVCVLAAQVLEFGWPV